MKLRIFLILLSNMFMLTLADILKFFKCRKLVSIILRQCKINVEYCEQNLRRVNK